MDTHGFASLARVPILLVPVGSISHATFDKYVSEIRSLDSIRLGDIPVDKKHERARFMPNPLSTGHLHLSFPTHPPPRAHAGLALIRPSHFPLAVIGLAECSPTDTLSSVLAQFNTTLLDLFPSDALYPLARNCFVFEDGDGNNSSHLGDSQAGMVVIPSMMGNKKLYISTLIADLCSNILGELGALVHTLESPLGNEYLNATLFPNLPPLNELPTPLDGSSKPGLPSHNSFPDSKVTQLASPPSMMRTSSAGSRRQSTFGQASRQRYSSIGVASSHGRLFKVLGDFYMIAGRTEDASIWYNEALQMFKTSQDPVWQASALEAQATIAVLDAWASNHGLQTSSSNITTREPWADITSKLTQATALYQKVTPPSDAEHAYTLLSYLYCRCILRHSSLLFSVWSAKGWGPLAFLAMMQPGTNAYLPPTITAGERDVWGTLERLSMISGVSRLSVATVLAQVHGPWLLHLGPRERISILEATASIYSCLGYRRKEAYILREILGCVMDLIVCGREEDGGVTVAAPDGSVGIRHSEKTDGNASLLNMLTYVCRTLGVDLQAVKIVDEQTGRPKTQASMDAEGQLREPFGWPELQVGVVREAIAVAEALPDHLSVAQFCLSSLKTLQPTAMGPGDQLHFYTTAMRALQTAKRRGELKTVEFWAENPLVKITVTPLPLIRVPNEKPVAALRPKSEAVNHILTGGKDPFLYNPRRGTIGKRQLMIVQNEAIEVVVILRNPYVFDLELDGFSLSTTGPALDAPKANLTIPARSYHRVLVGGTAKESGLLTIRGCILESSGNAREFLIPPDEDDISVQQHSSLTCEMGRVKHAGLEATPWNKVSERRHSNLIEKLMKKAVEASKGFLECKVVPEQPLLRIRRTSVTHGALMLYDGERSIIRLTVENISSLPIDFLRLAFDDSTIQTAQQALVDGGLSTFETYELEYTLIHRPLFEWNENEAKEILPGGLLTLNVQCFGKVGCSTGSIYATYAHVNRADQETAEVFHTRQLSYPLMVTVYRMLECQVMDIHPYPGKSDWCMFSVEIRNTYGSPFEVIIERTQEGLDSESATTTIAPGSTSRLVIALRKFILSEAHIDEPIPTLSDRQFVVASEKLSKAEGRAQRELFWYREELFKCMNCHWKEAGSGTRSGELSLRQMRMTQQMLKALRTDSAKATLRLVGPDGKEVGKDEKGRWMPPANEFVDLRVDVQQLSGTATLRVDLSVDPLEDVLYEGVLLDIPLGRLGPGDSREVSIPLCFLSWGRFTLGAAVRSGHVPESTTRLIALVSG
ncbi:hypothetical protein CYLTODRAFT_434842 [Cylindrobasidium torrendii FP15055 ss-10]|uniref:Trs120-domain-containing protein n=1 Tax=Cylindrobasidium torrendii FP15055 ss-10 TaxID=1314674 RepID=A0A0D7BPM9_9AGAR|nr:hypothetical protein CYLTODRAFT_434842 [Cylindrobasidium torrendii FP15055 ss-10]